MSTFKFFESLGCLRLAYAKRDRDVVVFHYSWDWYNPIVWMLYVSKVLLHTPKLLLKGICTLTLDFRDHQYKDHMSLSSVWKPNEGQRYFYPSYDGKKFTSATAIYEGNDEDLNRMENEYIFRSLADCDFRCEQYNMVIKYGKK